MKEILLTKGQKAIVDDDDYEYLSQWKWSAQISRNKKTYYAKRYQRLPDGKYTNVKMHRILLGVVDRNIEIDHINGIGFDNRRENLRLATKSQNRCNRRRRSYFSSKYKGVKWSKSKNKWEVNINVSGRRKYLGAFVSEEKAADIYKKAAVIYHGEFAQIELEICL